MTRSGGSRDVAPEPPRFDGTTARVSSLSHLRDQTIRKILAHAGVSLKFGWPTGSDRVAVWGNSGTTAQRGAAMARRAKAELLFLEDPFLRSVLPGKKGAPTHGLIVDTQRPYYDGAGPSDLEHLLATHPLGDVGRGAAIMTALRLTDLSKYNCHDPDIPPPHETYVLVVDQLKGDASVAGAGADRATFERMLAAARTEHPDLPVVVKTHPASKVLDRRGYLPSGFRDPISPWRILKHAHAVYTVSSQLGFEAIIAGHRPHVFGVPFYAGWGLSNDRRPLPRRTRVLTREQLVLGAMALYPLWYDPYRDGLCEVEDVIPMLSARARAWRDDHKGGVFHGVRLWKRPEFKRQFGSGDVTFSDDPARAIALADKQDKPLVHWASKASPDLVRHAKSARVKLVQIEDGFLRSQGLGAALVPPLSLIRDETGIYYDPNSASDLETRISAAAGRGASLRGRRLHARLIEGQLSKYNLQLPAFVRPCDPGTPIILVVGQVADDASIRQAVAGDISDTPTLIAAARAAHPTAHIVYKPHPDVEAGLRNGDLACEMADSIATETDPISAIHAVDEVWTLSSLIGFEALVRNRKVVCAGVPFYAGWGLTTDLAPPTHPAFERRRARPDLTALVEAVLIDYPRYFDPVTKMPCTVEIAMDRLEQGSVARPTKPLRMLSKLQGLLASQAWLWR